MEQKYILGIIALAIVAVLGISVISAYGFGMWNSDITDEEKAEILQQKEAIRIAIENGDYETWKSLMEGQLTEENFNELVEKHEKMSEYQGDFAHKGKEFQEGHFGKKGFSGCSKFAE